MPTKRPRHTITEVGDVADALARARSAAGEIDIRQLVVLGADAFVAQAQDEQKRRERRAALRQRLLERTTLSGSVDLEASLEVRERGWAREPDE